MSGPRVLLIEHERSTPAGLVKDWLEAHDADVNAIAIAEAAEHEMPRAYDLIVSLGSDASAYDDGVPWIGGELQLLGEAVAADVPVLGICFGGQLLARALGADVFRAREAEIGWGEVQSESVDLIPVGPWFQWHFDTFSPPFGARLLAHSEAGPQAFVQGRSLGLQFHPEVDIEIINNWTVLYRHELDEHGVDADELLAHTRAVAGTARKVSWALLEAYFERIAQVSTKASR
ncbi:MAG TPA: type 1 glutamine amidotransferase [Solirubrobacteraceae bacterium]|nr:type 1 glutamine amidotransferase [Solirubrobacteraceae bacterium]